MPPLSSLRPRATRKHTGASAVRYIHSDTLYLLLPQLTPMFSSSRPQYHTPLTTPLSWSPISKARHRDAAATVVVPESPIPRTYCLFLVLSKRFRRCRLCAPGSEKLITFELLNLFFFWWRFATVTVGCGCLSNLFGEGNVVNSWGANWISRLLYEEYTTLWFELRELLS